jgi:hypothetical protein
VKAPKDPAARVATIDEALTRARARAAELRAEAARTPLGHTAGCSCSLECELEQMRRRTSDRRAA